MCDKMVLEISQGTLEMFGEAGMLSGHEANEANEGSCLLIAPALCMGTIACRCESH